MSKHVVVSETEEVINIPDASEPIEEEEKVVPDPIHYKALVTLWHSVEARHVYPGEPVDLSHFDAATLADFIERGYVKRMRR